MPLAEIHQSKAKKEYLFEKQLEYQQKKKKKNSSVKECRRSTSSYKQNNSETASCTWYPKG